ncbi:hypothetical protein HAX54_036111, partial [Datura stramonium]|nr:hypothetical protein [Datura stramonium]
MVPLKPWECFGDDNYRYLPDRDRECFLSPWKACCPALLLFTREAVANRGYHPAARR